MRRSDADAIELALEDDPDEALALVRRLLDADDSDPDLWGYLAECETERGETDAALAAWAHYLTLDPHWAEAYAARAELFADAGELDAARRELQLGGEVGGQAGGDDARLVRAEALLAEIGGDLRRADALYADAEELDPMSPAPYRAPRGRAAQALETLRSGAQVEEMPGAAEPGGYLRAVEQRGGSVVFYLRNLERDLEPFVEFEDFLEVAEDALSDL